MSLQPWHELLPYGPLTQESYKMLALSYLDVSLTGVHKVAASRNIGSEDYLLHTDFGQKVLEVAVDKLIDATSLD